MKSKPIQMSDKELIAEEGNELICDVESYVNYFCICFKSAQTKKLVYFEGMDFNRDKLRWIFNHCTIITFNGNSYDLPMMIIALLRDGYTEKAMHLCTTNLIIDNVRPTKLYDDRGVNPRKIGKINHIDLINVAFGKASLKLYSGRLHSKRMQDLPYDPNIELDEDQKLDVLIYCINDLDNTGDLLEAVRKQINLRISMSDIYGMDLRSKSDAQIAESVMSSEIKKTTGKRPTRPSIESGTSFKYQIPDFIHFETELFCGMLDVVRQSNFIVNESGGVVIPSGISKLRLAMGSSVYKMGIGGLHSSEQCKTYISDKDKAYIEKDVASYYPRIILNQELFPSHIGRDFLEIYENIVETRLKAKREGDKITDASLKVTINGLFGKFGSKWSIVYAPDLLIQVTVTGQLALLMLIERLELAGFSVVSANTDGFITEVDRNRMDEYQAICSQWQDDTRFELEDNLYDAYYARDVNNYIGISGDKAKTKGCFRPADISKNPAGDIIYKAVIAKLKDDIPIEDTINECDDIRKFMFVQTVKGGAVKDGEFVGKVVRWYQKEKEYTGLNYVKSGNKVPKSEGGFPMMVLSDTLPDDLNRGFYIREANRILTKDFSKPEQLDLFGEM